MIALTACPYHDPYCPCQDGDSCHYRGPDAWQPPRRFKLIKTSDLHANLRPGDEGTLMHEDSLGRLHIHWDNGSRLRLIPGVDLYTEVENVGD